MKKPNPLLRYDAWTFYLHQKYLMEHIGNASSKELVSWVKKAQDIEDEAAREIWLTWAIAQIKAS